jgi:hypothetical protein
VIGHPRPSRYGVSPEYWEHIKRRLFPYGKISGEKRLSPGLWRNIQSGQSLLQHDCITLEGSSGSPVIHCATGQILGVHFCGIPARAFQAKDPQSYGCGAVVEDINYAIPSWEVLKILAIQQALRASG